MAADDNPDNPPGSSGDAVCMPVTSPGFTGMIPFENPFEELPANSEIPESWSEEPALHYMNTMIIG